FLQAILGGEQTVFVDIQSVVFEMEGISTSKAHGELHLKERKETLQNLMPPNTLADYERLRLLEKDAHISALFRSNNFYFLIYRVLNKLNKLLR
ncbi:MAG: hypothetical protein RL662_300, partial [Bacteroidota bacterium]